MLRDEILPYVDGNNLVTPLLYDGQYVSGSDNGPMYTSEYFIMLAMRKELTSLDPVLWATLIERCMPTPGLLQRSPERNRQVGPDDLYGVLAGAKVLNCPDIAQKIYDYGLKNFGSFNTEQPGKWTTRSFLWRQPQLIAAAIAAAGKAKFYHLPLFFITALVILFSGIGVEKGNTDARRLPWLLIQTVAPVSFLCELASRFWYKRLYKVYGVGGMREVAKIYYHDNHPFQRYWMD